MSTTSTSWIEAVELDDPSAVALLEQGYRTTKTYSERFRLAAALLRRSADDAQIWSEIETLASIAIRFPHVNDEYSPGFIAWCAEQSLDPEHQWLKSYAAFQAAARDPRSRLLFRRALATDDPMLLMMAIEGFARQRDETALP